jgi:cell wall-associated NlpC family hydrolase
MRIKYIPVILFWVAAFAIPGCSSSRRATHEELPANKIQKKYSELLDVPSSRITNKVLYEFIDKWLNTKYQYGSQQNTGIDCSGFTQLLYGEVFKKKISRTSESQYHTSKHISSRNKLQEGDLVFFTTIKGKKISHVGVYLQNNRFINATSKGVVISDMSSKYWDERFVEGGKPE